MTASAKPTVWISSDILAFEYSQQISISTNPAEWKHQYDIYEHAMSILDDEPNQHDLACAIFQLNRCIDFREKLLNQHYHFKKIPGMAGKKHHEAMELLGLIKPILKTKLDSIRNKVMHSASYPVPSVSEVAELAEFTWYFLKSTDLICSRKLETIWAEVQSGWVEADFNLSNWVVNIRGKFLASQVSETLNQNALELVAEEVKFDGDSAYVKGDLVGPVWALEALSKKFFSVL